MEETEGAFERMLSARKGRALVRRQSRLRKLLVGEVEHAAALAGGRKTDEQDDGGNRICRESRTLRVLCYRVLERMRQVEQNGYGGELLALGCCTIGVVLVTRSYQREGHCEDARASDLGYCHVHVLIVKRDVTQLF